jgi:hypothetical protein
VRDSAAPPDALLAGARACPVEAIRIFEKTTGRRIYP